MEWIVESDQNLLVNGVPSFSPWESWDFVQNGFNGSHLLATSIVKVNMEIGASFKLSRYVQQGYAIVPYFSILVADVLDYLLTNLGP